MDPPGLMLQQIELSVYWYPDGLLIVGKERKHRKQYRDGILPPQCKSRWGGSRYAFNDGYQAMVGSLMYAMLCTRPDLVYAVQQLLRFNLNPVNTHFQAAKRVFRYLQGTQTTGLVYGSGKHNADNMIQGYCNADYAADGNRKSISRYVFTLTRSPISWQAKKQTTVTQSMVEAEYTSMAHAAKELIWLQYLVRDLGMSK